MQIKQHSKVKYLGCILDETISIDTMTRSAKSVIS